MVTEYFQMVFKILVFRRGLEPGGA
uniref:Uncharacterized protein n=1 Tax=Arundo donax TaxID=35708 RepID=A0A0A9AAB2_ARUDO